MSHEEAKGRNSCQGSPMSPGALRSKASTQFGPDVLQNRRFVQANANMRRRRSLV
jgi:hypothetical protein